MRVQSAAPQRDRADDTGGWFAQPAEAIASALTDRLRTRVAGVAGLSGPQAWVIYRDARSHLLALTQQRLSRVLLLELHAASLAGELGRGDEKERWSAFMDLTATPDFRDGLAQRYPTLLTRMDAAGRNLVEAVGILAERLVADQGDLERLAAGATTGTRSEPERESGQAPRPLGELRSLRLGTGDPHRGGQTVSRLEFDGGALMYKPRPLAVDAALDEALATLLPEPGRIGTARTLVRDGYGWTSFVEHRYCADDAETELFYANLGRWLAVMRLIGGTDLHADNIVACGPVPVVVDAETMLAPSAHALPAARTTSAASAADAAARTLHRTVVRTGILPMRVGLLSGIDVSAVGRLPGEQPALSAPVIAGGGTDSARLVNREARIAAVRNHPNPDPVPERFWEHIVTGFLELSARLRELDANGGLDAVTAPFLGCEVRRVVRSTQVYGDILRMLWHPAALHDEAAAIEHARTALLGHARANPIAPADRATIDSEIAQLLVGDTPVYTARIDAQQLTEAVDDWRAADLELEARLIRFTLAGAFRDGIPRTRTLSAQTPASMSTSMSASVEERRRELAADAVRTLRDTAIHGADGTVTWIGPVLDESGWAVRALECDLHSGQAGPALCLAGYVHEAGAGRADHIDGISDLLPGALAALRAAEDRRRSHRIGALIGLAGQVWTWTTLSRLLDDRSLLDRAVARARMLGVGLRTPDAPWKPDWSGGLAGTITPLLGLAGATGDDAWLALAATAADLAAGRERNTAFEQEDGFAHGRAGLGWALRRIAASAAGDERQRDHWRAAADEIFDPQTAIERAAGDPGWCRGVAGIGLAASDLAAVVGENAKAYADAAHQCAEILASGRRSDGRSLCHGAAGMWECLVSTVPGRERPDAWLLDLLQQETRTAALIAETTAPGLLNGAAGTGFTLLRMHPEHELPSPLLLGV